MKALGSHALELLVGIGIALQAWTLSNVVDVRERVARLETATSLRSPAPAALELERPREILVVDQAVDHRGEELLESVAGIEGPAARHAELYDRLRALRGHTGPPVVPDKPPGIADLRR